MALALWPSCASAPPAPQRWWKPDRDTRITAKAPDRPASVEIGATVSYPFAGQFYLGDQNDDWDRGARYELDVRYRIGLPGDLDPFVGGYVFHEEQIRDHGDAESDYRATGLGAQLGAVFEPAGLAGSRRVQLALMPYSRLGLGWQHGDFQNLPVDAGTTSGDFEHERLEGAVGADVRLTLVERIVINLGAGVDGWVSRPQEGETRSPSGQLVDDEDRLRFLGWDAYVRLGVSLRF